MNPIFLFAVLQVAIGVDAALLPQGKIIGGIPSSPNEFPWLVRFTNLEEPNSISCSGTIINENWILTTADCAIDYYYDDLLAFVAGDYNRSMDEASEQIRRPQSATIHSDFYQHFTKYNIGLVKLSTPLTFNEFVSPAKLPASSDYQIPENVVVAGWGSRVGTFGLEPTDLVHKVTVPLVSINECQLAYPEIPIGSGMFCAGTKGKGLFYHNAGGPVHNEEGDLVVGLVGYGPGNFNSGDPYLFTDIPYFLDWIQSVVGGSTKNAFVIKL